MNGVTFYFIENLNEIETNSKTLEATTFYEFLLPLLMINAGIFTAKKYLNGGIAGIPNVDFVIGLLGKAEVIENNRVRFTSKEKSLLDIPSVGWGIQRVNGEDQIHTEIPDALVLIQRKEHIIRKKRKYFIVTAYPDIR